MAAKACPAATRIVSIERRLPTRMAAVCPGDFLAQPRRLVTFGGRRHDRGSVARSSPTVRLLPRQVRDVAEKCEESAKFWRPHYTRPRTAAALRVRRSPDKERAGRLRWALAPRA